MIKLNKLANLISFRIKNFRDKFHMKLFHMKSNLRGLDFVEEILPENNGLDPKKVKRCTHSNTPYLKKALKLFKVGRKDSILDIGCSKGAALLSMHKFSFNKIHGIEISDNLANIAKKIFLYLG